MTRIVVFLVLTLGLAARAVAAPGDTDVVAPVHIDRASCAALDLTPGAVLQGATDEFALATPIPWSEFEIEGRLLDDKAVVRKLLEPTLQQYRTGLSLATIPELALTIAHYGYQLVGHRTVDIPNGQRLVLHLAPLPLVRRVRADVDQPFFDKLLEDEILRRTSLRVGTYLPWEPTRRKCLLLEEQYRIRDFLFDEGYFDATVEIEADDKANEPSLRVIVHANDAYTLGKVTIACPTGSERRKGRCVDPSTNTPVFYAITDVAIRNAFKLEPRCLIPKIICYGKPRFTRETFQKSVANLKQQFQKAGYPSVRVVVQDPRETGVNHTTKTVDVLVSIDQRRKVDVDFQGYNRDSVSIDQLRKQLTFDTAGSADELEIAESARSLTTYLQTRGYFDARVTFTRDRIDTEPRPNSGDAGLHLDKIVFKIAMGERRRVLAVDFIGNEHMSRDKLLSLIATKPADLGTELFGTALSATSAELIADQDRIREAYRRIGYLDARVYPSASPQRSGLGSSALTAALIAMRDGGDLYVRFTIDEGQPTLLSRITITSDAGTPIEAAMCTDLLAELGRQLEAKDTLVRTPGADCAATIANLQYRGDDLAITRDNLRDYLLRAGRARSTVAFSATPLGPHRMQAQYKVGHLEPLKLGTVVIRGNFKTSTRVINDVLDLEDGQLLTTDRLALGARRLRNTGLFQAVNLEMPELDCDDVQRTCNSDVINAVVRVEERYDNWFGIDLEGGYSWENGLFGTVRATDYNTRGVGIALSLATTFGQKLTEYEAKARIPNWLSQRLPLSPNFTTTLTGNQRDQDTDRFGRIKTQTLSAEFSYVQNRPRTEQHSARVISVGPSYAFRLTSRNIDALRPIGADQDEAQVAVKRRTGQVGVRFNVEQRLDRNGQLQPLAPEDGQRLELSVSYAAPELYGQDRFVKFSASGSKFIPVGDNLVLRGDLRYDHGVPLGGAVLLPDVERFFAGGDNTVRGYSNERLATELIQVPVPPFDNVTQIRVIPAGGNIRVLGSVDAQLRIWKVLAGAIFSDAGLITNDWSTVQVDRKWGIVPDIPQLRASVGMGLRVITPFGIGALEYAVPLRVELGDDPRGKLHFYFAARAQF